MRLAIGSGCLIFRLKHDVSYLELLLRLFGKVDPLKLTDRGVDEPMTGQDARRVGFLYEFFTEEKLDINAETAGGISMSWMIRNG